MKTCIKFLITSTSIVVKTIIKIVERLKSYLHFQLKSFFLHASIIKKKSRTFSSTYSLSRILHRIQPSHSRSIQHSLFEIVAVVRDLLMQHKTYAKISSLILSTLSFSFLFNYLQESIVYFNQVYIGLPFIIVFINASASNLRNIFGLREFLIKEISTE